MLDRSTDFNLQLHRRNGIFLVGSVAPIASTPQPEILPGLKQELGGKTA